MKEDLFNFSFAYLDNPVKFNRSVSVVFDWVIGNDTCVNAQTRLDYACGGHNTCYNSDNSNGYRCKCEEGYDGNPYLPDGCQDRSSDEISCDGDGLHRVSDIDEWKTRSPCKIRIKYAGMLLVATTVLVKRSTKPINDRYMELQVAVLRSTSLGLSVLHWERI
ncbi:Wall-associated receptor kinase 2 [Morella rubra]|uniref:Wall-associated receptor kinase 2 n=1 Tax=Morella rubra TaxID=262757 RepID=A0A6A1UH64_9ROSI|nr:Wall-associated receptor kinase 2 [Morella rubra]